MAVHFKVSELLRTPIENIIMKPDLIISKDDNIIYMC